MEEEVCVYVLVREEGGLHMARVAYPSSPHTQH